MLGLESNTKHTTKHTTDHHTHFSQASSALKHCAAAYMLQSMAIRSIQDLGRCSRCSRLTMPLCLWNAAVAAAIIMFPRGAAVAAASSDYDSPRGAAVAAASSDYDSSDRYSRTLRNLGLPRCATMLYYCSHPLSHLSVPLPLPLLLLLPLPLRPQLPLPAPAPWPSPLELPPQCPQT